MKDFNLIEAYGMLDRECNGSVTPTEVRQSLRDLGLEVQLDHLMLLFKRYGRDQDGTLKYSDFTDAFMPVDQHYARQLGTKKLQYSQVPGRESFEYETLQTYLQTFELMINTEIRVE